MNTFNRNPPRPRAVPALCFALALSVSSGCYQYKLVGGDSLPTNAEVRARLATGEFERLHLDEVVELDRRTLEGRVLGHTPDTLMLLVPVITAQDWGFRERELNRGKTGVMIGFGVAILAMIVRDNITGFFGGRTKAPEPEKDGNFLIRIPWGS
jgi:hypothetical protein